MRDGIQYALASCVALALLLSPVVRATGISGQKTKKPASVADYPEFKSLVQRAYSGNPQAQYTLAIIYEEGRGGIKQDLAYAMSWYEEAARNGLKHADERLRQLARSR